MSSSTTRPYHHGNLRDAVLESAGRVLRDVGVDGLSFRQIARECGVSSAAPRRHFPTKQTLLDELAILGFGHLTAAMRTADDGGTAQARLRALADAYLDFAENNSELLSLMFARKHGEPQDPRLSSAAADTMAVIKGVVEDGQRDDSISARDPDELVLIFFTIIHGLVSLAATGFSEPSAIRARTSVIIDLIFDGIRPGFT